VTWDTELKPSSQHGVTTVVMGNCGVGFAPVLPGSEGWLIELMEGAEDIPGTALTEGMTWGWESFPQYLDVLAKRRLAIDVAAQIPHGAVRGYVMGERGANNEPSTPDEAAAIARLVREAIEAGAIGFSSSRINAHQAVDGRPVPGTYASEDELLAIAREVRKAGKGIFEIIPSGTVGSMFANPDPFTPQQEMQWMRRFAQESGRPVTFTLMQMRTEPNTWLELLKMQDEAVAAGIPIHGQFNGRPGGVLVGLQGYHPFQARPAYKALSRLPLADRAAAMRKPEVRAAILRKADVPESSSVNDQLPLFLQRALAYIFPLTAPLDYEPNQSKSIVAQAEALGAEPLAYLYDLLVEGDGKTVLIAFFNNFVSNDHRLIEHMLRNPNAILGLADGGAHARLICDASICTYLLTHWARARHRGPKFPVEMLIKKQSNDTARLYGFHDRAPTWSTIFPRTARAISRTRPAATSLSSMAS
jgi:N-acyl-D-amino-acid deacylase